MSLYQRSVRRAEFLTTAASCCGVTGETVLTDSAIILLYATSLGAGNSGALFSTSLLPLFNGLAVIPMAGIAEKIGIRKLTLTACAISAIGYFLAAFAPFLGGAETVFLGISCAALVQAGFIAGWFPLLNSFLLPERRVSFLGKMRFLHQLCATLFVLLSSRFLGKDPSTFQLQMTVLAATVIFCGRFFCILAVPEFPMQTGNASGSWFGNLKKAAGNSRLRKFSLYQCLFNLGSFGMLPLSLIYLKHLCVPENIIVFISGLSFIGMMLGYWGIKYADKFSFRKITCGLGILCLPTAIGFFCLRQTPGTAEYILIALSLMGTSFAVAAFSVISSAVMMNCVPPDNAPMNMAFANAFYYGSAGLSRLILSWITGMFWFEHCKNGFFGNGFGVLFFATGLLILTAAVAAPFFLRDLSADK